MHVTNENYVCRLVGKYKGKRPLGKYEVYGKIIIKCNKKCNLKMWTGCLWIRAGSSARYYEQSNENSGSKTDMEFLG
jgi:hypothetical protein